MGKANLGRDEGGEQGCLLYKIKKVKAEVNENMCTASRDQEGKSLLLDVEENIHKLAHCAESNS